MWIAAEWLAQETHTAWAFIGVFESEELAVAACYNDLCYVAPVTLNDAAGEELTVFEGGYYPSEK